MVEDTVELSKITGNTRKPISVGVQKRETIELGGMSQKHFANIEVRNSNKSRLAGRFVVKEIRNSALNSAEQIVKGQLETVDDLKKANIPVPTTFGAYTKLDKNGKLRHFLLVTDLSENNRNNVISINNLFDERGNEVKVPIVYSPYR